MKYVITGSTGNISKTLSKMLVDAGHDVSVITSNSEKIKEIEGLGAKAIVGSIEDAKFLIDAFQGADAVYTMIPPKLDAANWAKFIFLVGDNYANAIQKAGIKKVVNLSSMGAHLATGGGLTSLYYYVEQALNKLEYADVTHLRPGSFYYNFFGNIDMIKNMDIIGNNYADVLVPLVHPSDIAFAAFEKLSILEFTGKNIQYVVSDEYTTNEIANILGEAIGKPGLQWIKFKDEDALNGIIQAGFTQDVAQKLVEMGQAVQSGASVSDYNKNKPQFGPSKLIDFAKVFALEYSKS